VLAQLLADVVSAEWRRWMDAFTWIPADSSALRRRGFDHMELIARALVEQTGLPAMPLLIKRERSDQRQLNRAERKDNMATVFSVNGFTPASAPRHILLIDDVFTTGATLDAATRALLTAGIGEVRVATVARVW
jgi:predicted amidophosphoribosyltransferase